MPDDIINNNLPNADNRKSYIDLYELDKSDYMPYSQCLKKPLKPDCEYRGYVFDMQLHPDVLQCPIDLSDAKPARSEDQGIMRVKYYEYKLSCEDKSHHAELLKMRKRMVLQREFAAGPHSALVFSTKPKAPFTIIEDIMGMQADPLYSTMDSPNNTVGSLFIHTFRYRALQINPNMVYLFSKYTTDVDAIKKTAKDAYLNIVHDCDRYCVISSVGVLNTISFETIKQDGFLCASALKELPYSKTYKSPYNSILSVSKGDPHNRGDIRPYERTYNTYIQNTHINVNETVLQNVQTRLEQLRHTNSDNVKHEDASTIYAIPLISCMVPLFVGGSAVAYVARSSSKFAQSVRNKLVSITQTMRGIRRIDTQERTEDCGNAFIEDVQDI